MSTLTPKWEPISMTTQPTDRIYRISHITEHNFTFLAK
jgi:hypothetical protein